MNHADLMTVGRSCTGLRCLGGKFLRFPLLLGFSIAALLGFSGVPRAGAQSADDEYRVKAAFLFHFAQLVEWPSDISGDDDHSLRLCTLGEDPFHGELESMVEGKLVGTRTMRVKHLKETEDPKSCQILFIGSGETKRVPSLFAQLGTSSVLTVGETSTFLQQGGIIRFCLENNKVRFEINLDASQRAGIKISSRLLLLAKTVIGNRS
jgi:hypothetical protein